MPSAPISLISQLPGQTPLIPICWFKALSQLQKPMCRAALKKAAARIKPLPKQKPETIDLPNSCIMSPSVVFFRAGL